VLGLYLLYAQDFAHNRGGGLLVDALWYVMERDSAFRDAHVYLIRRVFGSFCRSRCHWTATRAIRGLTLVMGKGVRVPFDVICRRIPHEDAWPLCLSLLLRVPKYPVSRTLRRVLVERAMSHPQAFEVLWRLASQGVQAAVIVAVNRRWAKSSSPHAFALFLVIFSYAEVRRALVSMPSFGQFMARMASPENKAALLAMPTVLKMANLYQGVIDELTGGGFFKAYHAAVRQM